MFIGYAAENFKTLQFDVLTTALSLLILKKLVVNSAL